MTGVELHRRRCEAAQVDLVRAMRMLASALMRESNVLERGVVPAPESMRADIRELKHALLAYDKARAALDAVEAVEASR